MVPSDRSAFALRALLFAPWAAVRRAFLLCTGACGCTSPSCGERTPTQLPLSPHPPPATRPCSFERVRAMGDKWHARAAELSADNKLRQAAEARACSAALGSRAALLQDQLSLLSQAVREVKRCVGELDDQLTRTRAERDTARAADAATLAATAADLPAPLLERRLAALRAAEEEAGSARQELQSRWGRGEGLGVGGYGQGPVLAVGSGSGSGSGWL